MSKTAEAFRTISEVADDLDVPKHVLRFWEVKFPQIRPMKRGGGRRYYRPEDLELLLFTDDVAHAVQHIRTRAIERYALQRHLAPRRLLGEHAPADAPEPAPEA